MSQVPWGAWRRPALVGFILALAGEAGSRQREELMGAVGGTAAPGGQRELPDPALWLSHLILCRPLLLLPSIFPSIRVFSNESTLRMRWPKYWSFSFSIIPSKEIPGLISFM